MTAAHLDGAVVRMPQGLAEELLPLALSCYQEGYEPTLLQGFLNNAHEAFSRQAFVDALQFDPVRWMCHVTVSTRKDRLTPDRQWRRGFPHVHDWPNSATLVQFLQEPEDGGQLAINLGGSWLEVDPQVGVCVFCSGTTPHGVRPVRGALRRVAAVVTGWSD